MAKVLQKRAIDPYYFEYLLDTDEEDLVNQLIDDCVISFRQQGFKTAVITEAQDGNWLISCIAFKYNEASQSNQVISQKAELKTQDSFQFSGGQVAAATPSPALKKVVSSDPQAKPVPIQRLKIHEMEPDGFSIPDL